MQNYEKWRTEPFLSLDGDQISTLVAEFSKNMARAVKAKAVRSNDGCLAVANAIRKEVEDFRPHLPLIGALLNPGMRDRHWAMLAEQLPFEFRPDESLTLVKVLDEFKLQDHIDVISRVGDNAAKEYQIESALNKMEEAWQGVEFEVVAYKSTGTYVVRVLDEVLTLIDEHVVTTQAMQFSPFKKPFTDRIQRWAQKLATVGESIEELLAVQRQWVQLQAVFASKDINRQLPAESKRFASVNKTWRLIMSQVQANPDIMNFCDNPSLLQKLQDNNKQLQMVAQRISDYLDKKRSAFARFFFLSNEELLAILQHTHDPTAVQPHLHKCFENIHRLVFDEDSLIVAMLSGEGERVEFSRPVDPKGKNVEDWLGEVEAAMKQR